MRDRQGVEHLIRMGIFVAAAAGTVIDRGSDRMPVFILLLLIFLLNAQLRMSFFRGKLFLVSLFLDAGVVYFLYSSYGGLTCLLLCISIIDVQSLGREEGISLSFLFLCLLGYLIRHESLAFLLMHALLFLSLIVFTGYIRKLCEKLGEMELLYDENRRYSYQLEDAKKRLEDYSKRVERLSQLEERSRLSREIHDTLGHKLTGTLMQVEATIRVMEGDPDTGRQLLQAVRDNLNQGVETLRQTVRNMKPGDYAGRILSIRQMLTDFANSTGIEIGFSVSGNPFKLMPSADITLYRNAQEAVTNAVRHGNSKHIQVELAFLEKEVVLTVQDDGTGCQSMKKGMGISGMEERVELLGGRLEIASHQGFQVKTVIPVR
jgi:two-component system, NarL family, sensor kinase